MNINPKNIDKINDYYKCLDEFYIYAGDEDDIHVQKSIRALGLWDAELTSYLIQTIKPGWKCLDIGSSNGYFAEIMARLSGPTGSVLAFEPMKRLTDAYEYGKSFNDYSNSAPITMYSFGLSDENKNSHVKYFNFNVGGAKVTDDISFNKKETVEPVELKRLDSVYDETPDFIKIDIEDYESFAFKGFSENTLKCPLIVAELGGGQPVSFLNYLNKNYDLYNMAGLKTYTYNIIGNNAVNIIMKRKNQ